VHHNRISGFGLLGRDVGGIKIVGSNPEINGTRWDHNLISDGEAWSIGLYQDFSRDFVIDHNVVWDVEQGLNLNDGHDFQTRRNTLLGYREGLGWISTLHSSRVVGNVLAGGLPEPLEIKETEFEHNLLNADLTMGRDASNFDFRLKPQFQKPGLGAYDIGEELWKTGSSLPLPMVPPTALAVTRNAQGHPALTWKENASNERHYYVERSLRRTPKAYWRVFEVVAELPAGSTSWTDSSPEALANRPVYRVRADDSMSSNTVQTSAPGLVLDLPLVADFRSSVGDLAAAPIAPNLAPSLSGEGSERGAVFEAGKVQGLQIAFKALAPGDAVSAAMWLKPGELPGGNRSVLLKGKRGEADYDFTTRGDENISFTVAGLSATSTSKLPRDQWVHVAATYDGRFARLYINGELEDEKQRHRSGAYQGIPVSDQPLFIGGSGPEAAANSVYIGVMRDLRIYNNHALSPEEVKAAMKAGRD
jgi:hypothetical protein